MTRTLATSLLRDLRLTCAVCRQRLARHVSGEALVNGRGVRSTSRGGHAHVWTVDGLRRVCA